MIDMIVTKAIKLCRSEEAHFDEVAQEIVGPMKAKVALARVLDDEVQTNEQAKPLLIEMLSQQSNMDVTMLEPVESLAELVRNIAYHSDAIFTDAVIAGMPEYDRLLAERIAKYGETGD